MAEAHSETGVLESFSPRRGRYLFIQFIILFSLFFGVSSCYHFFSEAKRQAGETDPSLHLIRNSIFGFLLSAGMLTAYALMYRWYQR